MVVLLLTALGVTASAADPVVMNGTSLTRAHTCVRGQAVTVEGVRLKITLTGDCGAVRVKGSNNVISADGVARINVEGSANRITWSRNLSSSERLPVRTRGARNSVKKAR